MICLLHVLLCQITIRMPFNLLCILILFDAVMKMPEMTSRSCPSSQPEPSKSTHPYHTGEFLVPACSGLLAEWRCGWTRQGGWRDLFLYRCSLDAPGCTVECFLGNFGPRPGIGIWREWLTKTQRLGRGLNFTTVQHFMSSSLLPVWARRPLGFVGLLTSRCCCCSIP